MQEVEQRNSVPVCASEHGSEFFFRRDALKEHGSEFHVFIHRKTKHRGTFESVRALSSTRMEMLLAPLLDGEALRRLSS